MTKAPKAYDFKLCLSEAIQVDCYITAKTRAFSVGVYPTHVDVVQDFDAATELWKATRVKAKVDAFSKAQTDDYLAKLQVAKSIQVLCNREPSNQIVYQTLQEQDTEHD